VEVLWWAAVAVWLCVDLTVDTDRLSPVQITASMLRQHECVYGVQVRSFVTYVVFCTCSERRVGSAELWLHEFDFLQQPASLLLHEIMAHIGRHDHMVSTA